MKLDRDRIASYTIEHHFPNSNMFLRFVLEIMNKSER